jgi:hypothetical protein
MQADISSRPSGTTAQLKVSRKGGTRTDSMYRVQVRSISMTLTRGLPHSEPRGVYLRLHVWPLLYVHTIILTKTDTKEIHTKKKGKGKHVRKVKYIINKSLHHGSNLVYCTNLTCKNLNHICSSSWLHFRFSVPLTRFPFWKNF